MNLWATLTHDYFLVFFEISYYLCAMNNAFYGDKVLLKKKNPSSKALLKLLET